MFICILSGNQLDGAAYIHPMYKDMECPLLSGDHVTVEKGTGLVHTAPAHGPEDFQVALKHGLSIVSGNLLYSDKMN